ncbi:hypothetical protein P171DRAFT_446095 [Karstenula rhodostoma CBS 690.94]|uniref:Uncharacterized protein n=1 Tax=Karstenula rhodostoma CBS 690.94 TaxID=1392251 RepID=A0A9P4PED7_9PLEO|nr:hypothetical protein P171DRAFT_446095 [Karstenula rhodostoma CBS 690.94]
MTKWEQNCANHRTGLATSATSPNGKKRAARTNMGNTSFDRTQINKKPGRICRRLRQDIQRDIVRGEERSPSQRHHSERFPAIDDFHRSIDSRSAGPYECPEHGAWIDENTCPRPRGGEEMVCCGQDRNRNWSPCGSWGLGHSGINGPHPLAQKKQRSFEPMRNEPPHDPRQSWMAPPPPQHSEPTTPNPFSDSASYSDHSAYTHPIELQHIPPPGHH